MADDSTKIAELSAIVQAVRDRVRARYPEPDELRHNTDGNGAANIAGSAAPRPSIRVPIADLMPVVHARDAAQAKIAAIGSVNPRAGGPLNQAIQSIKKAIARALQWFVRDQISFNRETVSAIEAVMEALNEHNRVLVSLAAQANEQIEYARGETASRTRELNAKVETRAQELSMQIDARAQELGMQTDARAREINELIDARAQDLGARFQPTIDRLEPEVRELKDIRQHWIEFRAGWDSKVTANEIQFLRSVADLQGAFQHRSTLMESNFREIVKAQHADYLGALDRANIDIQKRLWSDLEKIRQEYDRLIHTELRLIRQRTPVDTVAEPIRAVSPPEPAGSHQSNTGFDYGRFAERFRGPEEYVRRNVEFYKPFFAGCENVLDIGCGRGEFLALMREQGVAARGIDLSEECVAQCGLNGLNAEKADLFLYLARSEGEFDAIFSSQVVEHLDPQRLPEMIRLCAANLRRGGLLAIETPNPECLAIFATHFYLDPTHTRPIPHPLLAFYMEEAGLGRIEVHELSPAVESMPEIAELPESFRKRFFGGLDYAIMARKL